MKKILKLCAFALILLIAGADAVIAQEVRFAVNMKHLQLEPGDKIVVRGNHARLGNWEERGELVLNQVRNTKIFGKRIRLNLNDEEVLYKYVLKKADGTEIWEQTGNRVLDTEQNQPVWFSNRATPGISQTFVNVVFRLDLTEHNMDGLKAEGVALMGMHEPLSFDPEDGKTLMTQVIDGVWEVAVAFPFGTPHDVPFKFMFLHEEEWIWEWRAGHTNHVFWIDDSETEQTIRLNYDLEKPGIIAEANTSGFVDDYQAIISNLGENGAGSRYAYELAMEQLKAGDRASAESTYANYKKAHPGGEEVDDFKYELAYHIQRNQGLEAADEFIVQELSTETNAERSSYLKYLRGELALRSGEQVRARRHLRNALKASNWDIADEYSQRGIIQSYLIDEEEDSVNTGLAMLEKLVEKTRGKKKQQLAKLLLHHYERKELWREKEALLLGFLTNGSGKRQLRIRLELANTYMMQGRETEALGMLDTIEFYQKVPKRMAVQVARAKIKAYFDLEMYNEVAGTFHAYKEQWPEDPFIERLRLLNEKALEQLGGSFTENVPLQILTDEIID